MYLVVLIILIVLILLILYMDTINYFLNLISSKTQQTITGGTGNSTLLGYYLYHMK
jgi:hypothetical protein